MSKLLKFTFIFFFVLGLLPAAAETLSISEDDVAAAVEKEFAEQGLDEDLDLEFFGGQSSFVIQNAKSAKIMVTALKYDETQNKFSVNVEVFADGNPVIRSELQGKYYVLTEAYVPNRNINKGEVITAADLKVVKIRSNRIKANVMTTIEQIQDKEAKRALKEGKLISGREIGEKILVRKGDIVSLIYKTEQMQITAKGQALSDGAKNQKIEVENTKSKKKVYGTVVDADTVEVNFQ